MVALSERASQEDPRQLAGTLIALGRSIPESAESAFDSAASAPAPTVVVTTERQVAAHNGAEPATPLVALYPSDGTKSLHYPFVVLDAAGGVVKATQEPSVEPFDRGQHLADFAEAVRAASDTLAAQGFRDGSGGGELAVSGVLAWPAETSPAADSTQQVELLRSWGVLNLRSRMLAVIDVSGSMLEPAGGGLRRIDVFQRAAVGAMQKFSGEVEMGVWVFSTNRVGNQDWEDLSPIEPLGNPEHTAHIAGIIQSLPQYIRGDTGLYDTVLAAVQRVRDGYDPSKVNSVLLFTDGKNDDKVTIDLQTLLAQLAAEADPLKPVPVILIGFGPDADIDSMTQIATATGGAAYSANQPDDLGRVLVDALSQRGCRPNC